jgi:hypothetical protein
MAGSAAMTNDAGYAWLKDSLFRTHLGYCVSLTQGLAPAEVLGRLGADPQGEYAGMAALLDRDQDVCERLDYEWGDFQLVGAIEVAGAGGPWTLTIEFNGLVGVTEEFMAGVTAGTAAVSHSVNPNGVGRFRAWLDGRATASFGWLGEPYSDTEALTEAITRVGTSDRSGIELYFSLAQEITGVRLTPSLLAQAVFTAGIVPLTDQAREQGWSWTDPDPTPEELAARDAAIRAWAQNIGIGVRPEASLSAGLIEQYEACAKVHRDGDAITAPSSFKVITTPGSTGRIEIMRPGT